jgi:hypothetical protein
VADNVGWFYFLNQVQQTNDTNNTTPLKMRYFQPYKYLLSTRVRFCKRFRQAGNQFLGSLKGLQIRARSSHFIKDDCYESRLCINLLIWEFRRLEAAWDVYYYCMKTKPNDVRKWNFRYLFFNKLRNNITWFIASIGPFGCCSRCINCRGKNAKSHNL